MARIASEGVVGVSPEVVADSLSLPPKPATHSVKQAIAVLVVAGVRSPTEIALRLNGSGFRTLTGKLFTRGNSQITSALKACP